MRYDFSLKMREVGRDIEKKLGEESYYSLDVVYPILSAESSRIGRTSLNSANVPGTEKYINYAISIALSFAIKMGDHKLCKAIKRFEKYDKELYEQGFLAAKTALSAHVSRDSRSEKVKQKQKEVETIKSDLKLSRTEKKKKLIALEKEISEIIYQGKKWQNKYERKYKKYLIKARKFNPKQMTEEFNKVEAILCEIWGFGIIQKLSEKEIEETRKKVSYEIGEVPFRIDSDKLDDLYAHLEELFYSRQQEQNKIR